VTFTDVQVVQHRALHVVPVWSAVTITGHGTAEAVRDKRGAVLPDAYQVQPERFIRKPPEPPHLPAGAWITPPDQPQGTTQQIPLDGASIRLTASSGVIERVR